MSGRVLERLHARGWFTGAVVIGGEHEVYARGFGLANVAEGSAFTPDTPSDGGSIAKTLTAAAVLMLVDEGRLDIDAPVRRYLPEYPHDATLIRHLLSHSAGLPEAEYDFFEGFIPGDEVQTTARHLQVLRERNVALDFAPGTRFQYSSLGFDVAALIVERVTGESWERFLWQRVFEPLGMRSTYLRPAHLRDWPGVRTLSYRRTDSGLELHDVFDREGFYGGSNVYFSARDLFRWSRSFYTAPVISSAARMRGVEAPLLRDTTRSGRSSIDLLGWYHDGRRYHYPGSLQGFWASTYRDESQRYAIAYVSNNSMPQWLRPMLTRWLIDIMEGRAPPDSIAAPDDLALDGDALRLIAGRYAVDGVGAVEIARDGERITVSVDDGLSYRAHQVPDRQLYIPGLDVWIGFPAHARQPFDRLRWLSIFRVAEGDRSP